MSAIPFASVFACSIYYHYRRRQAFAPSPSEIITQPIPTPHYEAESFWELRLPNDFQRNPRPLQPTLDVGYADFSGTPPNEVATESMPTIRDQPQNEEGALHLTLNSSPVLITDQNRPPDIQQPTHALICPLTTKPFENVVIARDGYMYDNEAIQNHYRTFGSLSPVTKAPLNNRSLTPLFFLSADLESFKKSQSKNNAWEDQKSRYVCPIEQTGTMKYPLATNDGYCYESLALNTWLESSNDSPINRAAAITFKIPNLTLKAEIDAYNKSLFEAENLESIEPQRNNAPISFMCPQTNQLYQKPVVAADGYTYEKDNIETHFRNNGQTSPTTKGTISITLTPNFNLKADIDAFKQAQQEGRLLRDEMQRYNCPLTGKRMKDPVIAPDGYTCEREAIEKWIEFSSLRVWKEKLIPNLSLKAEITAYSQSLAGKRENISLRNDIGDAQTISYLARRI